MAGLQRKETIQKQVVVFSLENEEFAIDIQQMCEVLKPIKITPLPHTADFVEGVINLRGDIVPVIDLRKRFGINERPMDEKTRFMILEVADNLLGVIVDQVSEVLLFSGNQIQNIPHGLYGSKGDFISGIAKSDHRLIIILNPEKMIFCREKLAIKDLKEIKDDISENLEEEIA